MYFAELQPDNSITKIIELSVMSSNDSNNRFDPAVGEEKCRSLSVSTSIPRTVVYNVCNYKLYPENGILAGGTIEYSWDGETSSWTDGTQHYTWDNTEFEWVIS